MKKIVTVFLIVLCAVSLWAVDYNRIDDYLNNEVRKNHIKGMAVIVVDKDAVLFSGTYGDCNNADMPFVLGSLSKSFTACGIMKLVEDGKIDLDKSITEYMDVSVHFKNPEEAQSITVRQLLNQTSGITTHQRSGHLSKTDKQGKHVYANMNYGLLGEIIENVSGLSYSDYMSQNVFKALGLTHTAANLRDSKANGLIDGYRNYFGFPVKTDVMYPVEHEDKVWIPASAAYITSSISDMGKYLQMYLNNGNGFLSESTVNTMLFEGVPVDAKTPYSYGMGWRYSKEMFSQPVVFHTGSVENFISRMFILPEEGIAAAVLVNVYDHFVLTQFLTEIIKPLLGETRTLTENIYLILHSAIDFICLLVFAISVYAVFTFKKKRSAFGKIFLYFIIPIILAFMPKLFGIPAWVAWLYVNDLFWTVYLNSAFLLILGLVSLFCVI